MRVNKEVSYFEGFSTVKNNVDLYDILIGIKNGAYQREKILEIRDCKKHDKDYSKLKKGLVGFTPSGTFKNSRKAENLEVYSGVIVLDIDNLGVRKLPKIKQLAMHEPHTLAVFVSPSGGGLKILVQVDSDEDLHEEAFQQVKIHYESVLNVEVDKSGKDVSRFCFISYDPELYFNMEAKVFQIASLVEKQFYKAEELTKKKYTYREGERNNFVYTLACNCNRFGIPKKITSELIHDKYGYDKFEVSNSIDSAYSKVLPPITDSLKEVDPVETYLTEKYDFRYNLVRGTVEFKEKDENCYKGLSDRTVYSLVRELKSEGLKIPKNQLVDLLESDFSIEFHPMKEYLSHLPKWDAKTDYLAEMAKRVSTDDNEFFVEAFKRWFVAMLACAIYPDVINQSALIFSGGQGIGKSTFIRNILPEQLREYLYSGMIDPKSKDSLIYLAECFIIDLDELSNLTRKGNNEMKEMITKAKVKLRRPYGRMVEDLPRHASFIGSVNENEFLTDTTGNRRYLCFKVDKIDYLTAVNYEGVYSQAYSLLQSGFKYYFDQEENEILNARNENFRQKSLLEDLLGNYKPSDETRNADFYMNAGEFLQHLNMEFNVSIDESNNIKLGKLLSQGGYSRLKKGGKYVYAIDKKSDFDNEEQVKLKISA